MVTGTVFSPQSLSLFTARPVVSYAVGTHGLAQSCAPSLQFPQGSDYENANIAAALRAGYSVLVSDYAGYTTGSSPTYLAGISQAHAVLDIVKAAQQIPSVSDFSASAPVGVWGYSQGGQSAAWAAQLQSSYAPGLNLKGVAAGGVPANFTETAAYLDSSTGESFLLGGVIGLSTQYPNQIPLASLANPTGLAEINVGKSECVFQSLFTFMNHSLSEYTAGNQTLTQIEASNPAVNQVLLAQNLGQNGTTISTPMYLYHGQADEFIPLDQAIALKEAYCSRLASVTFDLYPGEHIVTQFQGASRALSWLGQRFNGNLPGNNCLEFAAAPKSTANKGGGDFVVSLQDWSLGGTVVLKTLGNTITLPAGTMSASTDLTNKTLNGTLSIPSFPGTISVLGIPATVDLAIVEASPISGTVTLDNSGLLHIHGSVSANITVTSVGEGPIQIGFGCQTSTPVQFPLNFDGPVSALGSGALNFSGTTSFPQLTGCSIWNGLFSALMSGPGQVYNFTVTPPAPVSW